MKNLRFGTALIICCCAARLSAGVEGYFISKDGKRIPFVDFYTYKSSRALVTIQGDLNGLKVEQSIGVDLLAVEFTAPRRALVKGVTGKTAEVNDVKDVGVVFDIVDPVTDRVYQNQKLLSEMQVIVITGGTYNQNPKTARVFPSDFVFDPFDGTALQSTKMISQSADRGGSRCCPSCYQSTSEALCKTCSISTLAARINLSSKPIDYFIKQARVDPASERAVAAKRYVRAWLNPFSTEEQIIAALKNLIQEK